MPSPAESSEPSREIPVARAGLAVAGVVVSVLGTAWRVEGQELKIGLIDLYGAHRVSAGQVRDALTFKVGDRH